VITTDELKTATAAIRRLRNIAAATKLERKNKVVFQSSLKTKETRLVLLGGKGSQELVLLLDGLEASVAVLGRGVDELEVDGLEVRSLGDGDEGLAKGDGALAGARDAALEQEPVLVDLAVVGEATHGGDSLLGKIGLGGGRAGVALLSDAEHSLVELGTVMVTHLTGTGNREFDAGRMPCANARNLAETSVGLTGKAGDTPSGDNTGISVTTGRGADVQALTLGEDGGDRDFLLEEALGVVDLGGNIATVDLDLQQVGNLLAKLELADLGVGEHTHNLAVLLDAVELVVDGLGVLGSLLGVLGEGFLLRRVPVLVESASNVIGEMVSPDGGQGAEAVGGSDVSDDTDNNHRRGLDNGDGLDGLLLVELGARTLDLSHDVGHAGLVAHEGSKVGGSSGIVSGERPNATSVVLGTLLGKVLEGTATGVFEFSVRHFESLK